MILGYSARLMTTIFKFNILQSNLPGKVISSNDLAIDCVKNPTDIDKFSGFSGGKIYFCKAFNQK